MIIAERGTERILENCNWTQIFSGAVQWLNNRSFPSDEGGPEEVIKEYGSVSMENDLRGFLATTSFLLRGA